MIPPHAQANVYALLATGALVWCLEHWFGVHISQWQAVAIIGGSGATVLAIGKDGLRWLWANGLYGLAMRVWRGAGIVVKGAETGSISTPDQPQ